MDSNADGMTYFICGVFLRTLKSLFLFSAFVLSQKSELQLWTIAPNLSVSFLQNRELSFRIEQISLYRHHTERHWVLSSSS